MTTIVIILSIITALGIYNVWFIRPHMATSYRGRAGRRICAKNFWRMDCHHGRCM